MDESAGASAGGMAELDDIGEVPCVQYLRISGKIKGQTIYWVMVVGTL
jgi:hypothetical protein